MTTKAGVDAEVLGDRDPQERNHTIRGSLITIRSCFSSRAEQPGRAARRGSRRPRDAVHPLEDVGSVSRVRTPVLRSSWRWKLTTQRGSKKPDGLVSLPLIASGTW